MMSNDGPGPQPQHHSAEAEQQALYATLGDFLPKLLARTFEVPLNEAELLVDEVFNAYEQLFRRPPNARAWIIAGACGNANNWRFSRGLPARNEEDVARTAARDLFYREAVGDLPASFRKALRLRFEKKTYAEIAEELGVSQQAAERIVAEALARIRGVARRERG